jgi:uncharacterized protein (DUF697 family)
MSDNKEKHRSHANTIVKNHVIWSMGAGLIPIMAADVLAITALQLDMIRQLTRVYDLDFKETRGKAIVTSLTTTTISRMGARSLVKLIPGFGSFVGGAALSVFAGASTYALGQVFIKHFESGGTILDFDPEALKNFYNEQFEKGKDIARDWKNKSKSDITDEMIKENDDHFEIDLDTKAGMNSRKVDQSSDKEIQRDFSLIEEIEKLAKLKDEGIINEEEFSELKKKIIDKFTAA